MAGQMSCDDIERLVAPFADGTLPMTERPAVETHLAACPACRDLADGGRAVRALLQARAVELRGTAPEGLRTRLAPGRGVVIQMPARPRRLAARWVPLSAAAAVLLAVVAWGSFAGGGRVLAAQLTLDHLKCLLLADRAHGADPRALAESWEQSRGWAIDVPPSSAGLELVGLRRCLYGDGEMAHVLYERGGQPVSLFILPHRRAAAPVLEIMGHDTVAWSSGDRTYAVVGRLPPAELAAAAEYLRPLAR